MSVRSSQFPVIDLDPSDLAGQTHAVANYFQMLKNHEANRVHAGGLVGAPTSASTQATGAAGVTEWRVDVAALVAAVGGVMKELAVAADHVIHDTDVLLTAVGQSCYAAIVLKNVAGTITMVSVEGTPAATASAVKTADSVIQAAVGAGNDWVRLADCLLTRDGDTSVVQSEDNTQRPILGINADTNFGLFVG